MTDQKPPLSLRAYAVAMRMHESDNRIAKPQLEDFAHLDVALAPAPPAPERAAPVSEAAVQEALAQMQADARVKFAEPEAGQSR